MTLPTVRVSLKGAQALRRGIPWVYRTELVQAPASLPPGALVQVVDPQQNFVCQAFWATKSPIAVRLLSRKKPEEERIDDAFFTARLEAAISRRASLNARDGLRLIHGEADLLPGLFVDRYGPALVLQTLSEGAEVRKEAWAKTLAQLVGVKRVVCRDDASGRDFEQLPREKRLLIGEGDARVAYHEGPAILEVDLLEDMKTGGFLDQVDNHLRAGELARGEALDLFSYHGGFALALSRFCTSVLAVEQDEQAAKRILENARRNGADTVKVELGNAFDVLKRFDREGRKFDSIVLDPPGLAKRREGVQTALRAYHELNLRALRCLNPGGLLVTCSCSGKVDREAFERMILGAAADAKRPLQILERRGAGIDHPVLAALSETEYLKAWFVRAL